MAKVLLPLASGFEEIEAIGIIDVLRRSGIEVIVAGVDGDIIEGANKILVKSDCSINNITSIDDIDMIVLPGGWGGTKVLAENEKVQNLLKEMDSKNKKIGAICAAPYALEKAGVLKEGFTCYPSVEDEIKTGGYTSKERVVISENIMTSRGPGTAICFGLAIVKKLVSQEIYLQLKGGLLADFC